MACGIYKIENKINGKVYIGQSRDILERWKQHRKSKNKEDQRHLPLYKAFRKYGIENFSFEILEECSSEDLDAKEIKYIKDFNSMLPNGYNVAPGGRTSNSSRFTREEQDKIIQEIIESKDNIKDIAARHNLSHQVLYDIKNGHAWFRDNLTYPLERKNYITAQEQGKVIKEEKPKKIPFIKPNENVFALNKVSEEEIIDTVYEHSKKYLYEKYNSNQKTLDHYIKSLGLPYHTKDLKELYLKNHDIKQEKRTITHGKIIQQIDPNTGKVLKEFSSCCEAARFLGNVDYNKRISPACLHNKMAYGYLWAYK